MVHTGNSDPPPHDLDLSWSFSGMSVSGSMSHRLDQGLDASGLGLEVVGKQMSIPAVHVPSSHGTPHRHAAAGSMGPPLSAPRTRPPVLNLAGASSSGPSTASVALQLAHVSESYKGGLISPEERQMWKDRIISAATDVVGSARGGEVSKRGCQR